MKNGTIMNNSETIKSVIGYSRISTIRQSNNTSLEYQKQKINEFCKLKELQLSEVFCEVDSGGNDDRLVISQIKDMITDGLIECLLIWKIDRLARTMLGGLQVIEFCKEHNVRVISISDNIDTNNENSSLFLNLLLSIATEERRQIKKRCGFGREMKWNQSELPYPKIPFGYQRKNKKIVLDDNHKVVQYIFKKWNELSKTDLTKRQRTSKLIKLLKRNGYSFNNKTFRYWNIKSILTQSMYCGIIRWKDKVQESAYDTIISKRLFNQIQTTI